MADGRPADRTYTKFKATMREIMALVPDFTSTRETQTFYRKVVHRRMYRNLCERNGRTPRAEDALSFEDNARGYYCWHQEIHGPIITKGRDNPMEILHLLAHTAQPLKCPLHRGEFGVTFLTLVESLYDADMKRQVKDIMLKNGIKTATVSAEGREKQVKRYHKARADKIRRKFEEPEGAEA